MSVLYKRKGGGGHGGGDGGGGDGGAGGGHGSDGGGDSDGSSVSSRPSGYQSSSAEFSSTYGEASAYSPGSSVRTVVPAGVPFAGRALGGGVRSGVYGTEEFGTGYPYGASGAWVSGRPFPYGFWPLYYYPRYYGDDEYGPSNNSSRPGGGEMTAIVISNGTTYHTNNSYHILGDASSVRAVLDALVFNCSVVNSTLVAYNGSNTSMSQPEQAVQYYRSSSFVLFADDYNNTAALPSNAPASNASTIDMSNTPLPASLNTSFLGCLNYTIGNSVPMANAAACLGTSMLSTLTLLWILIAWLP